jgi:hypothetical protein
VLPAHDDVAELAERILVRVEPLLVERGLA